MSGRPLRAVARAAVPAALAWMLAACASVAPVPELPPLRLAPASLGRVLSEQQDMTIDRPGHPVQRVELLLEADAATVRLAVLRDGAVGARLTWDGQRLDVRRAAWWPEAVPLERVLSECQLSLWPADAVRAALPSGWRLDAEAGARRLWWHDELVIAVNGLDGRRLTLTHRRADYRLTIRRHALEAATP